MRVMSLICAYAFFIVAVLYGLRGRDEYGALFATGVAFYALARTYPERSKA